MLDQNRDGKYQSTAARNEMRQRRCGHKSVSHHAGKHAMAISDSRAGTLAAPAAKRHTTKAGTIPARKPYVSASGTRGRTWCGIVHRTTLQQRSSEGWNTQRHDVLQCAAPYGGDGDERGGQEANGSQQQCFAAALYRARHPIQTAQSGPLVDVEWEQHTWSWQS